MPPRIAYWCSSFDPEMEAVAGEVAFLRQAFRRSIVWGIAARGRRACSFSRGFGVPPRFQIAFRAATWAAQRPFQIQHLFGGLGDWFHLRAAVKRPIVMTVALDSLPCDLNLLRKVDRFVAEWPDALRRLREAGVSSEKIQVVYPPVDINRFRPAAPQGAPFTVLFASSPDSKCGLESRGVRIILDAAMLRPSYRFRLLWRPWGDGLPTVEAMIAERRLKNVDLKIGCVDSMPREFCDAHATVAPFTDLTRCKPAPNSIVESMASGRPVVVTPTVGLASLIEEWGAGLVTAPTGQDLANCLSVVESNWNSMSDRARALAEQQFSSQRFVESYRQLYDSVL